MNKFANEDFVQKVALNAQEKNIFFNEFFSNSTYSALAISNNRLLINSIVNNDFLKSKSVFETIVNGNKNYMQLRFLDEHGIEKIRCQRDKQGSKSYFVAFSNLQNKSDRYYFKLNTFLKKNDVWFSKIDLNEEHGVIEKPIKPVLRVVSPVYIKDKFKGLIVINIFMENFLEYLTKSIMFDIFLIDNNGDFLIHKDSNHSWSEYSSTPFSIIDEFGSNSKNILDANSLNPMPNSKIYVKELGVGIFSDYKLIFLQNDETLQKNRLSSKQMGFSIGFIAILLAFPMGFILSRPFYRLFEQLQDKSNEFELLVQNLEERVADEVADNRKKEQILMHQSKLASMGEMIGNIAHQWRQPLTRLSFMAQNIAIAYKMDKMDNDFISNNEKDMLNQIEFMSNTIDDFRNFFLPDREKESFNAIDSIKEALALQAASLESNHIKVKLQISDKIIKSAFIFGYKNEFAQVVLNLLNNSKDAFLENSTNNRTIIIKVKMSNEFIIFTFEDNAGGIDKGILTNIFEPYFTTKFKNQGTGIGLYMSKNIIEMHMNGKLNVENIDDGVCFAIEVPREQY